MDAPVVPMYVPGAHEEQTIDFVVPVYDPTGHCSQDETIHVVMLDRYVPTGQSVQVPADPPLHPLVYVPAVHTGHAVHTLLFEYIPLGQSTRAQIGPIPLIFDAYVTASPTMTRCRLGSDDPGKHDGFVNVAQLVHPQTGPATAPEAVYESTLNALMLLPYLKVAAENPYVDL